MIVENYPYAQQFLDDAQHFDDLQNISKQVSFCFNYSLCCRLVFASRLFSNEQFAFICSFVSTGTNFFQIVDKNSLIFVIKSAYTLFFFIRIPNFSMSLDIRTIFFYIEPKENLLKTVLEF